MELNKYIIKHLPEHFDCVIVPLECNYGYYDLFRSQNRVCYLGVDSENLNSTNESVLIFMDLSYPNHLDLYCLEDTFDWCIGVSSREQTNTLIVADGSYYHSWFSNLYDTAVANDGSISVLTNYPVNVPVYKSVTSL